MVCKQKVFLVFNLSDSTCNEVAKIKELSKTSLVVSLQKLFFQSVRSKTQDVTHTL